MLTEYYRFLYEMEEKILWRGTTQRITSFQLDRPIIYNGYISLEKIELMNKQME